MTVFALKGKIFKLIFAEIQSFGFHGDTLTGIVTKPNAVVIRCAHSFFAAEDLTVVQLYSVGTVAAGTWDFLTKEHGDSSFVSLPALYYSFSGNATAIFDFYRENKYGNC